MKIYEVKANFTNKDYTLTFIVATDNPIPINILNIIHKSYDLDKDMSLNLEDIKELTNTAIVIKSELKRK